MYFGSAWYPEQWPSSRWPEDLRLMREAGMNVVRVGEFAWSRMEPREGSFTLDWLEEAIDRAAEFGLETVLGTPTAAPPAWLTQRYPEVLRVEPSGRQAQHGGRGHFNPASPLYLRCCRRIAEEMAQRFGHHPHVIGWQIDNEYWPFSYDAETRAQFQQFLQERFGTLESLNRHWGTAYWSQEYSDWSQVPMSTDWQNPCLVTEFRRFFTQVYRRYQHNQVEVIRAHADPRQWITHNFHGWFEHGDPNILCEELDFASWDPYVGSGHLQFVDLGMKHDLVRGFKRRSFWVMETQPGFVNWAPVNNPLDRGEVRAMAWHLLGHGADAVLYWQWRSGLGGQEQYHGSIVGQSGKPRPLYGEVQQIGEEFCRTADLLRDTLPQSQVALLWSFDDRWAVNAQRHHRDFDAAGHMLTYYRPLREQGLNVDLVRPQTDLSQYALVIAPHLHLIDGPLVDHLLNYVQAGGHLVLGARSGMKDAYNALLPAAQPGPRLAEALGAHVEEFYALEQPIPVDGEVGAGEALIFAEWLAVDAADAEVLLRYHEHSWLNGQAAMVSRRHGQGRITYVGAWLNPPAMAASTGRLLGVAGVQSPFIAIPPGVEACIRNGEDRQVSILINHTSQPQTCRLSGERFDCLAQAMCGPEITLEPRGVRVLTAPPTE